MRNRVAILVLVFSLCLCVVAKDKKIILPWPPDKPLIEVTFGDISLNGSWAGKASNYVVDVEIENISNGAFPTSDLTLVYYDKHDAIVGNVSLYIGQRLEPHQKMKQQISFTAVSKPARVAFGVKNIVFSENRRLAVHAVSMTFRSVPEGANIDIDGQKLGVTPKVLRVPEGSHLLLLTKAGYNKAEYPFEVRAEDSNGGSVEVELPSSNDIIEMRDGSAVSGDIESVTWETVRVMTGDKKIDIPRNLVKRIIFVQRQFSEKTPDSSTPAVREKQ